jgi:hypothetical protein
MIFPSLFHWGAHERVAGGQAGTQPRLLSATGLNGTMEGGEVPSRATPGSVFTKLTCQTLHEKMQGGVGGILYMRDVTAFSKSLPPDFAQLHYLHGRHKREKVESPFFL